MEVMKDSVIVILVVWIRQLTLGSTGARTHTHTHIHIGLHQPYHANIRRVSIASTNHADVYTYSINQPCR